jgi:hypothetical protein
MGQLLMGDMDGSPGTAATEAWLISLEKLPCHIRWRNERVCPNLDGGSYFFCLR